MGEKLFKLLLAMRPTQWTKNLIIFAPLMFGYHEFIKALPTTTTDVTGKVFGAFWITALGYVLFCALTGGVYILNDLLDIEQDKLHPRKSKRPFASGDLSVGEGFSAALFLLTVSIIGSILLSREFFYVVLVYLIINSAYIIYLKHLILVDTISLAIGFVLRAWAGGALVGVQISSWLLMCTFFLSLFLALAKRRHELVFLKDAARSHRVSLSAYNISMLDSMLTITASACAIAYAIYCTSDRAPDHMVITIPFVMYGIFRYLLLVHTKEMGGSPEIILLRDVPIGLNILLWAALSVLLVYNDGQWIPRVSQQNLQPPSAVRVEDLYSRKPKALVTWNAPADPRVTGFNVYRQVVDRLMQEETYRDLELLRKVESRTLTLYTDSPTRTERNQMFRYGVSCIDEGGRESEVKYSDYVQPGPPPAPLITDTEPTATRVNIIWGLLGGTRIPDAWAVFVYRKGPGESDYSRISGPVIITRKSSYNDPDVVEGDVYSYRLSSVDMNGNESELSEPWQVRASNEPHPLIPSPLHAFDSSDENGPSVTLDWEWGETTHGVIWKVIADGPVQLLTHVSGESRFEDRNIPADTRISYTIQLFDEDGREAQPRHNDPIDRTGWNKVVISAGVPLRISWLVLQWDEQRKGVMIYWPDMKEEDLEGVQLERRTPDSDIWVPGGALLPPDTTVHLDTQVTPGIRYYYRVIGVDRGGRKGSPSPEKWIEIPLDQAAVTSSISN